jgi:CheY-like chemotaxis protein/HPt (histidine-containing phosphotransfer) domain-containing protein
VGAILTQAGYAVDEAQDGLSAVQAAAARSYDLILMDLAMPELDGVEATRRIRRLPQPGAHVPILAMTGSAIAQDMDRCYAVGMDGFLTKPIDRLELLEAVAHWVAAANDPAWGLEPRPGVTAPLLNRRTLAQLEEDVGSELMPELLVTFIDEGARRLRLLEERVNAGDAAGAADQAHALKGSSGTFGAMALRQSVHDLEQLGRAGDAQRLAALMPEVHRRMAATCDLLRADYPFLAP